MFLIIIIVLDDVLFVDVTSTVPDIAGPPADIIVLDDAIPVDSARESCRQDLGFPLAPLVSPPSLKIGVLVKLNVPALLLQPRPLRSIPCSSASLAFPTTGNVGEGFAERGGEEPSPPPGRQTEGVIGEEECW